MRNLNFAALWYLTVVFTLVFSILLLINISLPRRISNPGSPHYQLYKSLPATSLDLGTQSQEINKKDARSIIIENFFTGYGSPLNKMADTFIEVADKYNLDYRLLPAISMQESNGGKIIPNNSFNPFGYGIYGGKVLRFGSFEEAIERVGKGLSSDYINQGLKTPEEIMAKYTPPSLQKGGSWAIGVSTFMEELR